MYKFMNWRMYHPTNDAGGAPVDTPAETPAADAQAEPESGTPVDPAKETGADAKAEAQKMADAIVAKKLKGMPSKDELAEFRKWQESQKTPEQKESEEIQRLREKAAKVDEYERRDTVIGSGVAPNFAGYVAYEVGKLVTEETDFNTALTGYVKANPPFKGQPAPQRTQLPHGGSAEQMDGVEKAFLERNPGLKI